MDNNKNTDNKQYRHWLSKSAESLFARAPEGGEEHFDLLIVGSGYGGAIAAAELSKYRKTNGEALKIAVLERGKEYLPGMFPNQLSDLPTAVRLHTEGSEAPPIQNEALYDFRIGPHVNIVSGNGLGGGSLINAGVMDIPSDDTFESGWPEDIRATSLDFAEAKRRVGAAKANGEDCTILDHANGPPAKYRSAEKLSEAAEGFRPAAITVTMVDETNEAGVAMKACNYCGDCATGCNFGAKKSLDTNLLAEAASRGVELFTGLDVRGIAQQERGKGESEQWLLDVAYSNSNLHARQGGSIRLRCERLILAAGTLGSTELLMRSETEQTPFSKQLGQRFSSNGDMFAGAFDQAAEANTVVRENMHPEKRAVGPTITSIIDARAKGKNSNPKQTIKFEEMAVPGALQKIFEEVATTTKTIYDTNTSDYSSHQSGLPNKDPFAVQPEAIQHTSLYAAISKDSATGSLSLKGKDGKTRGALHVDWEQLPTAEFFERQVSELERLQKRSQLGGTVIANPAWRPLPSDMNYLLGPGRGAVATVHPLGGCAMADDAAQGVVNSEGLVFKGKSKETYQSLAVLDGAIVPVALGTNPALTITALALRAAPLLAEAWNWKTGIGEQPEAKPLAARPIYRDIRKLYPSDRLFREKQQTTAEFSERLSGAITLGNGERYIAELSLYFDEKPLEDFYGVHQTNGQEGRLRNPVMSLSQQSQAKRSELRLFTPVRWEAINRGNIRGRRREQLLHSNALLIAELEGTLAIMSRQPSTALGRILRTGWAWALNRGLRDITQGLLLRLQCKAPKGGQGLLKLMQGAWRLASRGGEVRLFEYALKTRSIQYREARWGERDAALKSYFTQHRHIAGKKTISYRRKANLWQQLEDMALERFPGFQPHKDKPSWLGIDFRFFARESRPLIAIKKQEDSMKGLSDALSFTAYFVRMFISIHLWSMRKPDPSARGADGKAREPNRLPQALSGITSMETTYITVDKRKDGSAVKALLSRYRNGKGKAPVMMIHGYSASGTTFAHPAVQPNLVEHLWRQGRDVWVLDMRSSAGLKTALEYWSFEQVAAMDIPIAVDEILRQTGARQVDIVAHCMGATMFSMAVLSADTGLENLVPDVDSRFAADIETLRRALPDRIAHATLSQAGPVLKLSPINVFRGFITEFVRGIMPDQAFHFRPGESDEGFEDSPSPVDRFLATLRYPEEEFELENPKWPFKKTSFVGSRHRMDMLYARAFSLANLSEDTLHHIDDLFGPLNLKTAAQVSHFAEFSTITDRRGRNQFVSKEKLQKLWRFQTLAIHGKDNGLIEVSTVQRLKHIMRDAGRPLEWAIFPGLGHQDSLIGHNARPVFERIETFFQSPSHGQPQPRGARQFVVRRPIAGPVLSADGSNTRWVQFASPDGYCGKLQAVFLPVASQDQSLLVNAEGDTGNDAAFISGVMQALPITSKDNWHRLTLPSFAQADDMQGVLLLLMMEDSPEIGIPTYGTDSDDLRHRRGKGLAPRATGKTPGIAIAKYLERSEAILQRSTIAHEQNDDGGRCFAFGSCQYPPGVLDAHPAYRSYRRLGGLLDRNSPDSGPSFALLLGDQIYADATAGVFDPKDKDDRYHQPYRRLYAQAEVQAVTRRLPIYSMLDDHELHDNFEPQVLPRDNKDGERGFEAFKLYQPRPNPDDSKLWYHFEQQGIHCFVADTRTERGLRSAKKIGKSCILGEDLNNAQMGALEGWLEERQSQRPGGLKFIASPSMFLPRHRYSNDSPENSLRSDGWDGYPASLYRLLAFIHESKIDNVVFLSGDEHIANITHIHWGAEGDSHKSSAHSLHSSGLYCPAPFANAVEEDFLLEDSFDFSHQGKPYHCSVSVEILEGHGFSLLRSRNVGASEQLEYALLKDEGAPSFRPLGRK